MTNDDLDRALAAAAANVGPSALDTLAREVRRLQGEAEATRDDHWARIGQYERRAEAAEAERDTLREQLKVIVAEHADCCFDEGCTAIEEVRNLVATFDAEARQKGTPT